MFLIFLELGLGTFSQQRLNLKQRPRFRSHLESMKMCFNNLNTTKSIVSQEFLWFLTRLHRGQELLFFQVEFISIYEEKSIKLTNVKGIKQGLE